MNIKFTKMHGIGNDFMVIDAINQTINLSAQQIAALADRQFGIGFDQLLMVESSSNPDVDFNYRIFNASGSEVSQCGNGARCFARFVYEKNLSDKNPLVVSTKSGIISLSRSESGDLVTVNMGPAIRNLDKVPFVSTSAITNTDTYLLDVAGTDIEASVLSVGNPHAVLLVDNVETAAVNEIGSALQQHEAFPEQVNVGFMQIIDKSHIKLRVFERGTGETLACGTGACAAVAAGQIRGLLSNKVEVTLPGGSLSISWQGGNNDIMMTGPAKSVFEGEVNI